MMLKVHVDMINLQAEHTIPESRLSGPRLGNRAGRHSSRVRIGWD
jgi:hypothetical protein